MSTSVLSKNGWIEKRGKVRKAWKTRWCMFRSDGALVYFQSIQDLSAPAWGSAKGAIPLEDASVSETEADKDGKVGLVISLPKRDYIIRCQTPKDRDEWVAAVRGAIELAGGAVGDQVEGVSLDPATESVAYAPVMFTDSGEHHPNVGADAFTAHGDASGAADETTWNDILGLP